MKSTILFPMGVFVCSLLVSAECATAQGTAFTYQGRLTDAAVSANGSYDLRFALFNTISAGVQVGGTLTNASTLISNGLFTVMLDFGTNFPGADRWLEIGVRTNGGGVFATLTPRQKLTPTPYAITAGTLGGSVTAGSFDTLSSQLTAETAARAAGDTSTLSSSASYTDTQLASEAAARVALSNSVWHLAGNSGTTPGANFLGTTDPVALELKVNGTRALRLEPTANDVSRSNVVNVIGGSVVNLVSPGVYGATISGGGAKYWFGGPATNSVAGDFGTVGGGFGNAVKGGGNFATVGGGYFNSSSGADATVGGGANNISSGSLATIGGGNSNTNSGGVATVAGGGFNLSSGAYATVGGGYGNGSTNVGATVGGGGYDGDTLQGNVAGGAASTVGGGLGNYSGGNYTTTAGGISNLVLGSASFVGGGFQNQATDNITTIAGGYRNVAGGPGATVGGGQSNNASGVFATIPGGQANAALGSSSFAAGQQAKANHDYTFVWADRDLLGGTDFASTAANQFLIRASGGVGIGTASPAQALDVRNHLGASGDGGIIHVGGTGANGDPKFIYFGDGPFVRIGENGIDDRMELRASIYEFQTGPVGIGRAAAANKLEVEGDASKMIAGGWLANSDGRIKTDVQTVTGALDKLDQVRLVQFHYTDEYRAAHPGIEDHSYLNVVAQEFQKVFPDQVKRSGEKLASGDDILQVDSYPLTIYSAAAIQELHRVVKQQENTIQTLKERADRVEELEQRLAALEKRLGAEAPASTGRKH